MPLSQITFQFDDAADKKEPAAAMEPKVKQKRGRKSLKEMGDESVLQEIPSDEVLFQKRYYSIGEVAQMFKENTSLIRYWEKEFDILKPKKNKKGDRYFRPEDVKNLKMIYHLLRERKYTIEGAREFLKSNKAAGEKHEMIEALEDVRQFLLELRSNL